MYQRFLSQKIHEALADMPVVYIAGPRQSGKSTLAKNLAGQKRQYITLDDINTLASAREDPVGFINSLTGPCVIDEIQRVPDLLLPIKMKVDQNRIPGNYLLTGSANILSLPQVADSLAGRMEIHHLYPLSFQEIAGHQNNWLSNIFKNPLSDSFVREHNSSLELSEIYDFIIRGGYPDAFQKKGDSRRFNWFKSYIQTLLERDIHDLAKIEDVSRLKSLLSVLSTRSGTLLNVTDLGRMCGIPASSLSIYLSILQTIFFINFVQPWFINRGKRLMKSKKVFLNDSGVLSYLLSFVEAGQPPQSKDWGRIVETFVFNELIKQIGFQDSLLNLYHYRSYSGIEVDFVIEGPRQKIIGIEVKASQVVSSSDFKGLRAFKEDQKDVFQGGVVLYFGRQLVPFAPDLYAVPIHLVL